MATNDGGCYRECQRNHGVRIGSHATDGCQEFLKGGGDGTPVALLCATCGCHRSFHRKLEEPFLRLNPYMAPIIHTIIAAPPPPVNQPPNEVHSEVLDGGEIEEEMVGLRKKARTKLMPWQKERMRALAERLGWRLRSQHDEEVCRLCSELEITPKVFKVWIRNNRKRWMENGESSSTSKTGGDS